MKAFVFRYKNPLALLAILILGGMIYSNVLNGPPIFDDIGYIKSNPKIHDLSDINAIWNAWSHPSRFIGYLTFAVNYHFHQYDYFGYHLVNILIHLVNTIMVWSMVRMIFQTPALRGEQSPARRDAIAFAVALLFATHPIQTQAVSYMAQRFASLATFFYLSSVYCYGRGRLRKEGGWMFFGISALCALTGMFTKQITMTLPLTILLFEWSFFQTRQQRFRVNWRIVAGVGAFLLIIPAIFKFDVIGILSIRHNSGSHRGDQLNNWTYLLTQFRVICTYIKLMFVPIGQNLLYDFKTSYSLFEPKTLASFMALCFLFAYGVKRFRDNRLLAFGIFWFFIALSVESSIIVIKHVIFEHRMYLPSFGFLLFVTALLWEQYRSPRKFVAAVCVLGLTLSVLTYQRNVVWTDDLVMWQDVIDKSPHKSRPYMNMGIAYLQRGEWTKAISYYNQSLERNPRNYAAFSNRGMAHFVIGKHDQALEDFNQALEIKDDYIEAYINRGNYFSHYKKYDLAIADYNKALEIRPDTLEAILNRGNKYLKMKQYDQALEDYNRTIELDPTFTKAYKSRAQVHIQLKDFELAFDDYQRAVELDDEDATALFGRGNLHFKKGNLHLALNDYNKALQLKPDHQKAQLHRSKLLQVMKLQEAGKARP